MASMNDQVLPMDVQNESAHLSTLGMNLTTNRTIFGDTGGAFNGNICQTQSGYDGLSNYGLIVEVYITSFFILFGFVGNTLTFIVLKRHKQTTTIFLMQALATMDTIYLVTCVFLQVYEGVYYYSGWFMRSSGFYPYLEVYLYPVARMAQMSAEYVVVLVTIERFVAVCIPTRVHLISTLPRMKIALACLICMSVLYNVPFLFEVNTFESYDPCRKVYIVNMDYTALYLNTNYHLYYRCILQILLRWIVPLSVLLVLNTKLILTLRGAWVHMVKMGGNRKQRDGDSNTITLMLVIVVIVFIICQTPYLTLVFAETLMTYVASFREYYRKTHLAWMRYLFLCNLLLTINSSINFIIYCLCGIKFRRVLISLLCSSDRNKKNQQNAETTRNTLLTTNV